MVKETHVTLSLPKGMKQTEIGLIPEDWEVVELSEIGTFKNGINKGAEDFGFGSPFINLMDVFGKTIITTNNSFGLVNSNNAEKEMYNIKSGDVIFIRSSVKPSGVGKTALVLNDLNYTVYSGFLIRYRNSTLSKNFKRYCFDSQYFRNNVIAGSTVSANINQDTLKSLKLAFPRSMQEQEAIAAALSDCDAWIESLETVIAKKRLIKQGAMQELLTPKEDWEVKKLGEIINFKNGAAHENAVDENGEYVIVNSKFISQDARVKKYSNAFLCPLYKDEIVMVMSDIPNGKALAKCFIIDHNNRYTLNQRICAFEAKEDFNPKFLFYKINRNDYFLSFDSGSGQTNLRRDEVLNCPIFFPSLSEQTRIATVLSDMDAELEALGQKLNKARQIKQGMMQELLTGRVRLIV